MVMKTESQNKAILDMLMNGRKVTPLDALRECGCFRLSARIFDLREKGYNIKTDRIWINDSLVAAYYME